MTQEQKNLIIGILVVVLVAGGVYYYKNKKSVVPLAPEEQGTPNENNIPLTPEQEVQNKVNSANAEELKAQEAARKIKFNLALANGQKAFTSGNYNLAISYYNEALSYQKSDVVYARLFYAYSAQGDIEKARLAIETAIKLHPTFTDYWNTKLTFLDEKTTVSFTDLKKIYQDGLTKVDSKTKIDLVTHFARIAETNYQKGEAIALWKYAQQLYPQNTAIYQVEIDRLQQQ